jgi:RimJ/RimL family protein N-acetyltransferase
VLPHRQGEGLATEAAAACLAFAQGLGKRRVIAIMRPDNGASRRVAAKIGLTLDREAVKNDLAVVVYAADLDEAPAQLRSVSVATRDESPTLLA